MYGCLGARASSPLLKQARRLRFSLTLKAVAQRMQEELLGDASGSTPVRRQLTHFRFR